MNYKDELARLARSCPEAGLYAGAGEGRSPDQKRTKQTEVAAICPGYIRTPMTRETQSDPALLERALSAHPLGRLGDPEDVAGAAFYLASDDAAWVTGTALTVDGGYTCV